MSDRMNDPRTNPSSPDFKPIDRDEGRSIGQEYKWRYPAANPQKPAGTSDDGWGGFQDGSK